MSDHLAPSSPSSSVPGWSALPRFTLKEESGVSIVLNVRWHLRKSGNWYSISKDLIFVFSNQKWRVKCWIYFLEFLEKILTYFVCFFIRTAFFNCLKRNHYFLLVLFHTQKYLQRKILESSHVKGKNNSRVCLGWWMNVNEARSICIKGLPLVKCYWWKLLFW